MAYTLPDLPYAFDALEPHIDARTMEIHHDKHHAAYVNNVNAALEGSDLADLPIEELLTSLDRVADDKRNAVRNNGGGHYNHSLFWTSLSGSGGGEPAGALGSAVRRRPGIAPHALRPAVALGGQQRQAAHLTGEKKFLRGCGRHRGADVPRDIELMRSGTRCQIPY